MLPFHPCLSLLQDCPGESLTPFLARRIITVVKAARYDPARTAEYRAAGEAAARACGTLDVGLRSRIGDAYEAWLSSRRKELPALIGQLVRGGGGSKDASAAVAAQEGVEVVAGADVPEPLVGESSREASDGAAVPAASRGQLKKDAKRLIRQLKREQRLVAEHDSTDAPGAGITASAASQSGQRHGTADLEHFAAAVGWKRSRGDSPGAGSGAGDSGAAVSMTQSRRAHQKELASQKVALMMVGATPLQIGQVPFMRPSVAASMAAATASGVAATLTLTVPEVIHESHADTTVQAEGAVVATGTKMY